jgi:hypothetical protein
MVTAGYALIAACSLCAGVGIWRLAEPPDLDPWCNAAPPDRGAAHLIVGEVLDRLRCRFSKKPSKQS